MSETNGPWPAIRDEIRRKAASVCPVCNDTGVVTSPDPGGESVYESACPEPAHDGEDVTFPADSSPSPPLDDWNW